MDDVGKAIVMVGQILLFILACSVSIVLYSAIKNNVDMSEFQVLIKYFHNFIGRTAALHALQMVEK